MNRVKKKAKINNIKSKERLLDEIKLIWKRKKFIIFITLLSLLIAGTINFKKYNKYDIVARIKAEKLNQELVENKALFKSMFIEDLDLKHPLKVNSFLSGKEKKYLMVEIRTGDPDVVKKRLRKLACDIASIRLDKRSTSADKIFYTILFMLCVLIMTSVFVLVFFEDEKKQ